MLKVLTNKGEFNSKNSYEEIKKQLEGQDLRNCDLTLKGSVEDIQLNKGHFYCDETIYLTGIEFFGVMEYDNFVPITTKSEVEKLKAKIIEDTERLESLEEALKDKDFQEIIEKEDQVKALQKDIQERKSAFQSKIEKKYK